MIGKIKKELKKENLSASREGLNLKSFNDLKQPNHYIRELMVNESHNYTNNEYVLMYTRRHTTKNSICFFGKSKIDAFIKFYDFLNTEKCLIPFDRHTTCLDAFFDEHIFKGKEFSQEDIKNFDLKKLNDELICKLTDAYCNLDLFDDELIGTHKICGKIKSRS